MTASAEPIREGDREREGVEWEEVEWKRVKCECKMGSVSCIF